MKKILIILFLLLTETFFSQTKKETEDWIEEKYNQFESDDSVDNAFDLFFENGYLYQVFYHGLFKIKIEDIKEIEFKILFDEIERENFISLHLLFDAGKLYIKSINESIFRNDTETTTISLYFREELKTSGYQERLEKAILHLIKLNGGNAKVKKEPF